MTFDNRGVPAQVTTAQLAAEANSMILQDRSLHKGVVAYGFLVEENQQTKTTQNRFVQIFHTALDVRQALACAGSEVQVLICESSLEVSPLNLAAALHKDNPLRDIYLEKDQPNGLFVSRVETAGARGVVSKSEVGRLLGIPQSHCAQRCEHEYECTEGYEDRRDQTGGYEEAPIVSVNASELCDLSWLEQVLELDDLDDYPQAASVVVVERPTWQLGLVQHQQPLPKPPTIIELEEESGGVVAAFVSGRGGVGKSSLAVLSALELWHAGSRVVLLDMDLQFGDLSVLAGNEPQSRIQRLGIEQLCGSRITIPSLKESLLLLEAPQNPECAEELVLEIPRLLAALKGAADIVLINTSCLWNEAAAVLASSVDRLVVCMDQRATSISAARQVLDLCIRLQMPSTKLLYLLNRCARNAPISSIDASLAMGGVDIITIAEGGADVDELLSLGCPLELLSAQGPLRQSIRHLGACLQDQKGIESGLSRGLS